MSNIAKSGVAAPLPHNLDAERDVLGAILLDNDSLCRVRPLLSGKEFFLPQHMTIFRAIARLADTGSMPDLVILTEELGRNGELERAGGAGYVAQLIDGVPRVSNVEHYAQIVIEKYELRQLIHGAQHLQEMAFGGKHRPEVLARYARMVVGRLSPQYNPATVTPLVALTVEELLAKEVKPREMLLDPILPEQGLAMLYSYRGIGKTFLALGIAAAVASGGRFLRWAASHPRRVLYVDGELPAATLQERAAMILAGMDGGEPAPGALRFITPDVQGLPMPDLATCEGQRQLEPHLPGVALLILDNLSALCRYGSENEGEDWLPVQEWGLGLRRRGISVLFVHHAGKNRTQRGTSRREDLLDTVITLKHPSDYNPSEGLRCEIHFEKTRSMLGDAAKPFEVRMETGAGGQATWTWRELEDAKAQQAAELFASGVTVRDVAEELGISKSAAGRLRRKWEADRALSQRPTV